MSRSNPFKIISSRFVLYMSTHEGIFNLLYGSSCFLTLIIPILFNLLVTSIAFYILLNILEALNHGAGAIINFHSFISSSGMRGTYKGCSYTWTTIKNQVIEFVQNWIMHFLILQCCWHFHMFFLICGSDHSPVVFHTNKPFRFKAFWLKQHNVHNIVKTAWIYNYLGHPIH